VADAMHWLGVLHAAGLGEPGCDHRALALMWIAKAAAHGHAIGRQQLEVLLPPA
jgi:TPR repeat protein